MMLHCFTGDWEEAKLFVEYFTNCYVSFSPKILNNKKLESTVWCVPPERLLIETDAPHFPLGGQERGMPQDIIKVGVRVAMIKHMPPEEIFHVTARNAKRLFSLPVDLDDAWRDDSLNFGRSGPFAPPKKSKEQIVAELVSMGYNRDFVLLSLLQADNDPERAKDLLVRNAEEDEKRLMLREKQTRYRQVQQINIDFSKSPEIPTPTKDGRGTKRHGIPPNATSDDGKLGYSGLFKRFADNFACRICDNVDKQHEVLYHCQRGHILCQICFRVKGDETSCRECGGKVKEVSRCLPTQRAIEIFKEPGVFDLAERNQELELENKDQASIIQSLQEDSRITSLTEKTERQKERIEELEKSLAHKTACHEEMSFNCNSAEVRERAVRSRVSDLQKKVDELEAKCKSEERLRRTAEEKFKIAEAKAKEAGARASKEKEKTKAAESSGASEEAKRAATAAEKALREERKAKMAEKVAAAAAEKAAKEEDKAAAAKKAAEAAKKAASQAAKKAAEATEKASKAKEDATESRMILDASRSKNTE